MTESRLAHVVIGPDEGLPLVLLHAFPLDRTMWQPVVTLLRDRFRLVLIDLPGLGESPLPAGEPSLAVSAHGVAGVLDDLDIQGAVLAGVSMGGYVIMEFLRHYPGRVLGAALIDTKAAADDEAAAANRERIAEAVLGAQGTRVLEAMVPSLLGESSIRQRPAVVEWVAAALAAAPVTGVAWSQRAMARRADSVDLLESLAAQSVPVVVAVGAEDTLSPPEVARQLADAAGAELVVVPKAGHLAVLEAPEAIAAELDRLMARASSVR